MFQVQNIVRVKSVSPFEGDTILLVSVLFSGVHIYFDDQKYLLLLFVMEKIMLIGTIAQSPRGVHCSLKSHSWV